MKGSVEIWLHPSNSLEMEISPWARHGILWLFA
jgi:hypothetical protein